LSEHHWTPQQFYELNREERCFIMAAADMKMTAEKKAQKSSGGKKPRKGRK
jgi:hypothetical protein